MKPELKPCPFCGGVARLHDDGNVQSIYCIGCTATVKQPNNLNPSVTDKWNRRAQPAEHTFSSANEYHAKIVKVLQEYGNVNELFGHVKITTFNHDELLEAGLNLLAVLGNDVTIQAQPADPVKHDLYKTGDKDAPRQILDRNGEVVLGYCKRCGKAEIELSEPCIMEPVKVPSADEIINLASPHLKLRIDQGEGLLCFARDLLQKYGKLRADNALKTNDKPADRMGCDSDSCAPSFDDWFKERNSGLSFDEAHMGDGALIDKSMNELSRQMRDYVTEMAQQGKP